VCRHGDYLPAIIAAKGPPMPILFFILVIILIAQIGFWKTLGAILGAAVMIGLLIVLAVAAVAVGGLWLIGRARRM
jgi:hypothetical protein